MSKKKSIGHVISHTHWDREWRTAEWNARWRLKTMMEKLLDKLENNPKLKFLFDGQVVSIHDYLEICPERKEQVENFIKNNQLQIGPWYNLPDLYPICGEALIRNLLTGIREADKLGKCLKIAYTTFGWGQTAQFPQIFDGFGIERVVCGKNVSKKRAPNSEFMWESPDGTKVFTTRLGEEKRANFFFFAVMPVTYGCKYIDNGTQVRWGENGWLFHSADSYIDSEITLIPKKTYHPEMIKQSIEHTWETTSDSLVPEHVFMGNGCDSTAPSDVVDNIIQDANKLFEDKELVYSDLQTYFEKIEQVIKEKEIPLKIVHGELRDGPVHSLSANALATRMPLKVLNRKAQNALIRYAEPFAVLAESFGIEYPKQLIDKAWQFLLLAHSHDAINGVTLDKTADDTTYKLNQIIEIGQVVTDMSAIEILKKTDLKKYADDDILLAVFNPTAREVDHIVDVAIDIAESKRCRRLKAYDSEDSELTVQNTSHAYHAATVCVQNSRALPFYCDRHKIKLETGKIPAYGYKIIKLVPDEFYNEKNAFWLGTYEQSKQTTEPYCMENKHLKVEINPDGTYNVTSKSTDEVYNGLGFYEDGGDVGDYWQRVEPEHNKIFYSKGIPATIYLKEDGPLVTTYVCDIIMKVPAKADKTNRFATARVDEIAEIKISTELTLKADSPYLEVKATVNNSAMDHRLRVGLPTYIKTDTSHAMGHFNVDSRPIGRDYKDGIRDGQMSTLPMQNFLDLSDGQNGLAILNKELIEFEITEDKSSTAYLTLMRCMDVNICTEGRCGTIETGATGPQCLGEHTFNYAVYPHKGDWAKGDVYNQVEKYIYTPRAYQISKHENGTMQENQSLLEIDNPMIQISTIKKAQDADGIIARIYNPNSETEKCTLSFASEIENACTVNMNEEKEETLKVKNKKHISLDIRPCKIVTLLIQMEASK